AERDGEQHAEGPHSRGRDITAKSRVEFRAAGRVSLRPMNADQRIEAFEKNVLLPALEEISRSPALARHFAATLVANRPAADAGAEPRAQQPHVLPHVRRVGYAVPRLPLSGTAQRSARPSMHERFPPQVGDNGFSRTNSSTRSRKAKRALSSSRSFFLSASS